MTTIVNWEEQTTMVYLQYHNMAMSCVADVLEEIQSQNDFGRASVQVTQAGSSSDPQEGRKDNRAQCHIVQKHQNTAGSTLQ
jgi:hypothetical protein